MTNNQIKTLLFCKGWKQYEINLLVDNVKQRYNRDDEGLILFAMQRAYDLTADGKARVDILKMFAPESKE
jgi:hypothetical protein